jgi:hypothetical protein
MSEPVSERMSEPVGELGPSGDHLVVRAPNWVGDLVMATPVLEAAIACADDPGSPWTQVTVVVRRTRCSVN